MTADTGAAWWCVLTAWPMLVTLPSHSVLR
jgi:hypothetical protein